MNPIDRELYELFSDKTLSEGCLFSWYEYKNEDLWEELEIRKFLVKTDSPKYYPNYCIATDSKEYCIYEILWHEPQYNNLFTEFKAYWCEITLSSDGWLSIRIHEDDENEPIDFDTSKSLVGQDEKTKKEIIEKLEKCKKSV